MWWLIGGAVLAVAVAIAVLTRSRSKKQAWGRQFTAAEGEVAWFARDLIRKLEQAPTAQQMAGGWNVEAGRVTAVDDHLTALLASAPDDAGRARAGTLRDAVRAARTDLAQLATTADTLTARDMLSATAMQLETALARVGSNPQPAGGANPPR